jgi:hypothetical protein
VVIDLPVIDHNGVELGLETVRALRGEEVDFARYELGFVEEYRRFQERQLAEWLLSVVTEEGPLSRDVGHPGRAYPP